MKIVTTWAVVCWFAGCAIGQDRADQVLALTWDSSPPLRTGPLAGFSGVIAKAEPSVVAVLTRGKADDENMSDFLRLRPSAVPLQRAATGSGVRADGVGSGVILTEDGYILTSNHVIAKATEIRVALTGASEPQIAKLVGRDPTTDIAVLKVEAACLPAATLGNSAGLLTGDIVLAIGNPFGLDHTVTSGIVSALGRKNLNLSGFEDFIQTDASINPGSSGGALIDNRGRVVGINVAILSESGGNIGIGFAVPIEKAVEIAEGLISRGEISRGYVGAIVTDLSDPLAKMFSVTSSGVLVNEVFEKSPGERAGLKAGDVIVRLDGNPVRDPSQLNLLIAGCIPGTKLKFDIVRWGEEHTLTVEVEQLPLDEGEGDVVADNSPIADTVLTGMSIANLDLDTRFYYGVPTEIGGVVVASVNPGTPGSSAGLAEGDVIMQIGKTEVDSVDAAAEARKAQNSSTVLLRVINWKGVNFLVVEDSN